MNTGSDATPTYTSGAVAFGGSSGANEMRFANSGASTTTASASWPYITRPASGTATVSQMWGFTADTTGLQVATYTGSNANANVLRWNWDNTGTQVAAPQFSYFNTVSGHVAPTPGDNSIAGGNSTDTSSMSYMKINAYGAFTTTNLTAGSVGTNPSATTGNQGTSGVNTCTASDWLNTHVSWQDAQGWLHYVVLNSTPTAVTAGDWNWTCVLFVGVNMSTGSFSAGGFTLQYTYS